VTRALLWSAVSAYAAGFSALSALRHESFATGRFDLGNMVQAVWTTAHGHPLLVTNLRGEQVSRLGSHFDPVLAVFAPLWWLWPSPGLLLTAQALLVAIGALPVFWLARKHLASERAAVGFALAYLLYPPLEWLTLNEFHPVALATPLLLFAIWYLDEARLRPFAAFALAAVTTREEVAFAVAGIGVWYAVARGRRLAGAAIALSAAAVALVAIGVVVPHFGHGTFAAFGSRYSEVGGSLGGILETAVTEPWTQFEVAFDRRGVGYLLALFLPLAGLWLFAPLALVPAVPQLALNLLSATPTQTSIHFHYTAPLIPPLVVATVLGAARMARSGRVRAETLAGAAVAVSLVANYRLGPIPLWRSLPGGESLQAHEHEVSDHDRVAARALRRIPEDAVVSASNSLGGHLSERRRVLSFPFVQDAGWVAVDETKPSFGDRIGAREAMAAQVRWLGRSRSWRLVFRRDGVLLFRRLR
jgi:uncharacterized membrane protein